MYVHEGAGLQSVPWRWGCAGLRSGCVAEQGGAHGPLVPETCGCRTALLSYSSYNTTSTPTPEPYGCCDGHAQGLECWLARSTASMRSLQPSPCMLGQMQAVNRTDA